ncbi:MAG: S8 family serine peptidase, partial [Chloroflexi bacterium]|nr:S8 family serine peptidase [Chloroflexota bacterium]
ATEGVRDQGVSDGCLITSANNADDVISFSSRGPTSDGRLKPDLMAPGTHIQGPASQVAGYTGTDVCNAYYPANQTLYTWSSGTSHATPAVSGAASLLYEYYGRVWNPGWAPSPAMLKALLLNTPRYLTGTGANDTLPSPNQGWGDVNLGLAFNAVPRLLLDQLIVFTDTGQVVTVTGSIFDSRQPFRVSLVWTDAPGSTTGNAYVNDLDLEVTVGDSIYKGNVFVGAQSVSGGSADPRNNVENVFLPQGLTGTFTVRVIARNIAGDSIPNNTEPADQDFALVVYNAGSGLSITGVQSDDALGNANRIAEPGERVALQISLLNSSTLTATNVSSILTATSSLVTVTNGTSAYADMTLGAPQPNRTPYQISISPALACGSDVEFLQTVTFNNNQTFTLPLSLPTGTSSLGPVMSITYTGTAVLIPDNNPMGVTVTLTMTGSGVIGDVNVHMTIVHTYDADLALYLISPQGTAVTLSNHNGGNGGGYLNTTFDDSAATWVGAASAPFSGVYKPDSPLSTLNGEPISGVWALHVTDNVAADVGTINAFALDIQTAVYTCVAPWANHVFLPTLLR